MMVVSLGHYLVVSAVLLVLGVFGIFLNRNCCKPQRPYSFLHHGKYSDKQIARPWRFLVQKYRIGYQ